MAGPNLFLEIISWLSREADSRLGVMPFDIQHDIQSNDIHLLARSLWRLQHIFEDGIHLLWRANTLGKKKERLAFYGGPDSVRAPTLTNFSILTVDRKQSKKCRGGGRGGLHAPIVDVAYGAMLDVEWRESMQFTLFQEQSDEGRVRVFVAHDFNRYRFQSQKPELLYHLHYCLMLAVTLTCCLRWPVFRISPTSFRQHCDRRGPVTEGLPTTVRTQSPLFVAQCQPIQDLRDAVTARIGGDDGVVGGRFIELRHDFLLQC